MFGERGTGGRAKRRSTYVASSILCTYPHNYDKKASTIKIPPNMREAYVELYAAALLPLRKKETKLVEENTDLQKPPRVFPKHEHGHALTVRHGRQRDVLVALKVCKDGGSEAGRDGEAKERKEGEEKVQLYCFSFKS